jgi:hypothetical protein
MNIPDTGLLKETKRPMREGVSSMEASLIISMAVFVHQLNEVRSGRGGGGFGVVYSFLLMSDIAKVLQ